MPLQLGADKPSLRAALVATVWMAVVANARQTSLPGRMSENYRMLRSSESFARECPEQGCQYFVHWATYGFKPWYDTFAICKVKVRRLRCVDLPKPAKPSFSEKPPVPIVTW